MDQREGHPYIIPCDNRHHISGKYMVNNMKPKVTLMSIPGDSEQGVPENCWDSEQEVPEDPKDSEQGVSEHSGDSEQGVSENS